MSSRITVCMVDSSMVQGWAGVAVWALFYLTVRANARRSGRDSGDTSSLLMGILGTDAAAAQQSHREEAVDPAPGSFTRMGYRGLRQRTTNSRVETSCTPSARAVPLALGVRS